MVHLEKIIVLVRTRQRHASAIRFFWIILVKWAGFFLRNSLQEARMPSLSQGSGPQTPELRNMRLVRKLLILHCLAGGLCTLHPADSEPAKKAPYDLTEQSLDELMKIEVKTSSRKEQSIYETAGAITVITQEDIRRSGATTIAEALRMAPGLNVARIDANKWAISSRGFNDFFANKLLVLNDGRSVYTPLFSGVFWDVQDTVMEDIERIEVIRGPGAALWGANAVNGVINIITKSSKDTQGGLISAGGGTEENGFGSVRYGGKIKDDAYYRVYAKYFNRDDFRDSIGREGSDEWDVFRGGFRTDWDLSPQNTLNVQGDIYSGTVGQRVNVPTLAPPFSFTPFNRELNGRADVSGGNVLGAWKHNFSDSADLNIQMYYDRTERRDLVHLERRDTYDLDAVQHFTWGDRQEFVVGAGYRYTTDKLGDGKAQTGTIVFTPDSRGDQLFSTFLQDEITLVPERLRLTLGTKLEHNDYTGFEVQPSTRLLWTPNRHNSVWGAVSRAVRTPSRFEDDIRAHFAAVPIGGAPTFLDILGNPNYHSEKLIAYEIGYRVQPIDRASFDLALFYNDYEDLRTVEGLPPVVLPQNNMRGETYGAEISANLTVTKEWRLSASYTALKMQLHQTQSPLAVPGEGAEGDSPQNQFQIRSYLDLPYHLQLDSAAYYVDHLTSRGVPGYVRWDVRLGWRPRPNFDLSLNVQNILDDRHPEFGPGYLVSPTEVERCIYAKATWRF
jgi:iron complex outermembrane receptor protein